MMMIIITNNNKLFYDIKLAGHYLTWYSLCEATNLNPGYQVLISFFDKPCSHNFNACMPKSIERTCIR